MGLTRPAMQRRKARGSIQVPHNKWTADAAIAKMGAPKKVIIPMNQHIGARCEPTVQKGDIVKVGQVIGDTPAYVSAPIHASVSGIVTRVGASPHPGGSPDTAVEIESDGLSTPHESVRPHAFDGKEEFLSLVRASGLVGLGGAGFPTHVKLNPPQGAAVDTLIINGAECEPYITSDYRAMVENARSIVAGACAVMRALGIPKAFIGIEDNKPDAIRLMKESAEGMADRGIEVVTLKSTYPQGAEKMLIHSCTGRRVPPGKLPADIGAVVMNVCSAAMVDEYLRTGMPLIKKLVTVSGDAVMKPMNLEVPIGTALSDVFAFCGGFRSAPEKVIMGGPMMGIAQHTLGVPVVKHTNALLAFSGKGARAASETGCIRCGRCVDNCPMSLMPLYLDAAAAKGDTARLGAYHVKDCIECGACVYTCPAKRRIVQSVRLGKELLRREAAATKEAGAARSAAKEAEAARGAKNEAEAARSTKNEAGAARSATKEAGAAQAGTRPINGGM